MMHEVSRWKQNERKKGEKKKEKEGEEDEEDTSLEYLGEDPYLLEQDR